MHIKGYSRYVWNIRFGNITRKNQILLKKGFGCDRDYCAHTMCVAKPVKP